MNNANYNIISKQASKQASKQGLFLSIIIPVYNAEKYLEECLDSCLNQDIDKSQYEIICINDGSKDNSLAILNRYAEENSNIVIVDQPNGGVSVARNKGIDLAKGDYVWFVDSDDFIGIDCLKKLKELSDKNYDIINLAGYSFVEELRKEEQISYKTNRLNANETYWGYAWMNLYKLAVIKENRICFVNEIKYGEDEMFYNDVFSYSEAVLKLKQVCYYYRKNSSSVMNNLWLNENRIKHMDSIVISMALLKNGIETGKYKKAFSKEFLRVRYRTMQHHLKHFDIKTARNYFVSMKAANLFDFENMEGIVYSDERFVKRTYFKQHLTILLRSKIKLILPEKFVEFVKKFGV